MPFFLFQRDRPERQKNPEYPVDPVENSFQRA